MANEIFVFLQIFYRAILSYPGFHNQLPLSEIELVWICCHLPLLCGGISDQNASVDCLLISDSKSQSQFWLVSYLALLGCKAKWNRFQIRMQFPRLKLFPDYIITFSINTAWMTTEFDLHQHYSTARVCYVSSHRTYQLQRHTVN